MNAKEGSEHENKKDNTNEEELYSLGYNVMCPLKVN
jgi:hypothetical protein